MSKENCDGACISGDGLNDPKVKGPVPGTLQHTENFLGDKMECKTRSQVWDFLYATEYECESMELNEAMAAMTDEQVWEWFPKVCAEFYLKQIGKL